MSQSSNAFTSGIYTAAMRNAAPALFCVAILLFILSFTAYGAAYLLPADNDSTDTATRAYLIIDAVLLAFNNAVVPFAGAAIVWALQNRAIGGAK
jgi:quinol-cytochrome oxidoreductase complex cytochrome b subunit